MSADTWKLIEGHDWNRNYKIPKVWKHYVELDKIIKKRSKKPQEKSHRKTGRNSRNVTLGLYITSQNKFVEKYFTGKRKVKYENGNILHQEDQVERWKEHFCSVLNRENTANIKMNNQQN